VPRGVCSTASRGGEKASSPKSYNGVAEGWNGPALQLRPGDPLGLGALRRLSRVQ